MTPAEAIRARVPGDEFTADDIYGDCGYPDSTHQPNGANSAVGAAFRHARAAKLIEPTGRTTQSKQPHRKGGMIQVWRRIDGGSGLFDTP